MSYQPPPTQEDRSVGELVFDVSERVSGLVREEIALAKAEISEKVSALARGGAVGAAAGIFAFLGLILLMHAIAWLLNDLFFEDSVWAGFLIEAVFFFAVGGLAGFISFKEGPKGARPRPGMAIGGGKREPRTPVRGSTPGPVPEPGS